MVAPRGNPQANTLHPGRAAWSMGGSPRRSAQAWVHSTVRPRVHSRMRTMHALARLGQARQAGVLEEVLFRPCFQFRCSHRGKCIDAALNPVKLGLLEDGFPTRVQGFVGRLGSARSP